MERIGRADGATFESINPTTGAAFGRFVESSASDVDAAVRAAHAAFEGPWRTLSPTRRGRLMMRWGDLITENAEKIATIETEQNGKLFAEMRTQARIVQDWLYYFGGLADKIEGRVVPLDRTSVLNYTMQEPLGVVAAIVPWNSPTFLTIMTVGPALAAGNTIVIKPSEVTSASAFELARLAEQAGIPRGVINVVTGARAAGEALVAASPGREDFVHGQRRGGARNRRPGRQTADRLHARTRRQKSEHRVRRCRYRPGRSRCAGWDFCRRGPNLRGGLTGVFPEGNLRPAGGAAGRSRENHPARRSPEGGNPDGPGRNRRTALQGRKDGRPRGRGRRPHSGRRRRRRVAGLEGGYFYEPTILEGARSDAYIMQNEVFGPVLCVTPFETEEEVLKLANGTPFGLAAGVWTRDIRRGHLMARKLQAGTVWINTYRALAFNSPFGGFKNSGLGRLNGAEAIQSFLQTKSVWCELSSDVQDPFVIKA